MRKSVLNQRPIINTYDIREQSQHQRDSQIYQSKSKCKCCGNTNRQDRRKDKQYTKHDTENKSLINTKYKQTRTQNAQICH